MIERERNLVMVNPRNNTLLNSESDLQLMALQCVPFQCNLNKLVHSQGLGAGVLYNVIDFQKTKVMS